MRKSSGNNLTSKQTVVIDFLTKFIAEHGYPPAVREICTGLPVTPSAMIFPLTYLICQIECLNDYLVYIYSGVMLLVACLFIGNYHIFKKPKLKGVILVIVIGLILFGLLMYAKYK